MHESDQPGRPIDQGPDGRQTMTTDDQVAPEIAGPGSFLHHGRSLVEHPGVHGEPRPAALRRTSAQSKSPASAQVSRQIPLQTTLTGEVDALIDGLVTN